MSNGEPENQNESANQADSEQPDESGKETASASPSKFLDSVKSIQSSNPKVFYGGIGVLVIVLLFLIFGGSKKELPVHQAKEIVIGQSYVLKSANAATPDAPIKLVSVPGSLAAYDDTDEDDRSGCKLVAPGSPIKAIQTQDAFGKADAFVQVEVSNGECKGHKGWVLSVNIQ